MSARKTKGRATEFDRKLGQNLRSFRLLKGHSQKKLADVMDVQFQQVQKYETGKNRIPIEQLLKAADFLDVPLEDLLTLHKHIKSPLTRSDVTILSYWQKTSPNVQNGLLAFMKAMHH